MNHLAVVAGGLALLGLPACTAATGAGATTRTVEIRVHHSRFLPGNLTVRAGTTVRFVLRNDDPIDHEFIVGDEALQLRHERGTEPTHGERPTEVTLPAASRTETTIRFAESGRLTYACHLPGHLAYGMSGTLEVTGR